MKIFNTRTEVGSSVRGVNKTSVIISSNDEGERVSILYCEILSTGACTG